MASWTAFAIFVRITLEPAWRDKSLVEHNSSGVELRTLDFENPGSNPVLRC